MDTSAHRRCTFLWHRCPLLYLGSRESISNCTPRTCTFRWRWRTMMHSATNTRVKCHGKLIEKNQKVTAEVNGRIGRSLKTIMLPHRSTYRLAQLGNELFEASMWDDCAKVSTLLSSQSVQSFINYQDDSGFTPLHGATAGEHVNVTELLIAARCNVNATSKTGRTALISQAQHGLTGMAHLLIGARCNVDQQMYDGATPIYMAAFFGHLQITELLMEARANLDLEHENGYTPLMISAYNGHRAVATLLLAARSKIHIDAVELDAAIIGGVGIEKLPGSCKGRLGVWLHEDFQCTPEDEEEEKEEDSMWRMTRINVEEDEDEEKEEPLSD